MCIWIGRILNRIFQHTIHIPSNSGNTVILNKDGSVNTSIRYQFSIDDYKILKAEIRNDIFKDLIIICDIKGSISTCELTFLLNSYKMKEQLKED